MEIKCPSCSSVFQPNKEDEKRVLEAVARGQKLLMSDCPVCYKSIPINPTDLMFVEEQKKEITMACPVCSDGIVSYIDDGTEKFWGCGECGNVWFNKESLDELLLKMNSH